MSHHGKLNIRNTLLRARRHRKELEVLCDEISRHLAQEDAKHKKNFIRALIRAEDARDRLSEAEAFLHLGDVLL